jgi:uncharacterized lipoprotein NlpE involved in copper resistance
MDKRRQGIEGKNRLNSNRSIKKSPLNLDGTFSTVMSNY